MATHSSILAWIIPWTEEPGGLQSIGSQESIGFQELDMTKQAHIKSIKKHSSKNTLQKKKTLQTARAMYGRQHRSFYLILLSKQKNKEPPVLIHPQKMMQS